MKLFVGGYDIEFLLLADLESEVIEYFKCSPDEYLENIVAFLESKGAVISDLSEIHAVLGPGSSTALRASLSITNTLSYTLSIPLYGHVLPENWDKKSLFDIIKVVEANTEWPLLPVYQHEPRITLSHKDQLQR